MKVLPRTIAEGLGLLWRINSSDTDAVLALVVGEDGQGVAVSDVDNPAGEFGGVCKGRAEQQGERVAHGR
jgi:hypothetical protein